MTTVTAAIVLAGDDTMPLTPETDSAGPYPGTGNDDEWGLRSAFPSAAFTIEHRVGRTDSPLSPRSATRRSLTGRHDG